MLKPKLPLAEREGAERRKQALLLVSYNLAKLNLHITTSRRILNDLRSLRRLLLAERNPQPEEESRAAAGGGLGPSGSKISPSPQQASHLRAVYICLFAVRFTLLLFSKEFPKPFHPVAKSRNRWRFSQQIPLTEFGLGAYHARVVTLNM
jgi:hypothetical protein